MQDSDLIDSKSDKVHQNTNDGGITAPLLHVGVQSSSSAVINPFLLSEQMRDAAPQQPSVTDDDKQTYSHAATDVVHLAPPSTSQPATRGDGYQVLSGDDKSGEAELKSVVADVRDDAAAPHQSATINIKLAADQKRPNNDFSFGCKEFSRELRESVTYCTGPRFGYDLSQQLDLCRTNSGAACTSALQQFTRWFTHDWIIDTRGQLSTLQPVVLFRGAKFRETKIAIKLGSAKTLLKTLWQDADFTWNTAWPIALFGFLIHDLYKYMAFPDDRYLNTPTKIAVGSSFDNPRHFSDQDFSNQQTLSNTLGGDLVGTYQFWLGAGLLVGVPLLNRLVRWASQRNWDQPLSGNEVQELKNHTASDAKDFSHDTLQWLPYRKLDRHLSRIAFAILYDVSIGLADRKALLKIITDIAQQRNQLAQLAALRALANIAEGYQETGLLAHLKKMPPSVPLHPLARPRVSLFSDPDSEDKKRNHEIKKRQQALQAALAHTQYEAGMSYEGNDSFFDALATVVKKADITIPNEGKEVDADAKALRMLCKDNVVNKKKGDALRNPEILQIIRTTTGITINEILSIITLFYADSTLQVFTANSRYDQYIATIGFTQPELAYPNQALQGHPVLEGAIVCQELGVKLHVVNIVGTWNGNTFVCGDEHQLIDFKDSQNVQKMDVDYTVPSSTRLLPIHIRAAIAKVLLGQNAQKTVDTVMSYLNDLDPPTVHLATYNGRYVPLMINPGAHYQQLSEQYAQDLKNELTTQITEKARKVLNEQAAYHANGTSGKSIYPLPRYTVANYHLWRQGKNKKAAWHSVFWPSALYVLYSKFRLVEILMEKARSAANYFTAKNACESNNEFWRYTPETGSYDCYVCPPDDWKVYFGNAHSSQSCLDGVLARKQTPQDFLDKLDVLLEHPDFKSLDLSLQELSSWPDDQFKKLLDKISAKIGQLDTLNLSSPVYVQRWPQDNKIKDLADFLQRVKVRVVNLHNQGIGPGQAKLLFVGFKNNSYDTLILSSNALGDNIKPLADDIAAGNINVTHLHLGYNLMTDYGMTQLAPALQNPLLKSLHIPGNNFGDQGMLNVTAMLPASRLEHLVLDGNPLSSTVMDALGSAASKTPSLKSLSTVSCKLDDYAASVFGPYLPLSSLTDWNLAHNFITGQGFAFITQSMQGAPLQRLGVAYNQIDVLSIGASSLPNTNLTAWDLSYNQFQPSEFMLVTAILPNITTLVEINAAGNTLDGITLGNFFGTIANSTTSIRRVNVSDNAMDDTAGESMVDAMQQDKLTHLIIAKNKMTDVTGQLIAIRFSQGNTSLVLIDLSGTSLSGAIVQAIAAGIPNTPLQRAYFNSIDLSNSDVLNSLQYWVSSLTHWDELGNPIINIDLARAIQRAQNTSQLIGFGFAGCKGLTDIASTASCRLFPPMGIKLGDAPVYGEIPSPGYDYLTCQTSAATRVIPWTSYIVNAASYFAIHQQLGFPTLRDVMAYLSTGMNRVAATATATAQMLVLPAAENVVTENTASASSTLLTPSVATSSRYSANLLLMGLSVLLLAYIFSKLFSSATNGVLNTIHGFFADTKNDDAIRVSHKKPKQLPAPTAPQVTSQAQLMDIKGMFKTSKPNSAGATAAAKTVANVNANNKF